jgi:hypothetical protein
MNQFMDDDRIVQVFLSCEMKNPEGVYADEVDLIEFADALIAAVAPAIAAAERREILKLAGSINAEVARLIEKRRS